MTIKTTLRCDCDSIYDFMVLNNLRKPHDPRFKDKTKELYGKEDHLEFKTTFSFVGRKSVLYLYDYKNILEVKIITLNSKGEELGINSQILKCDLDYSHFIRNLISCLESLENHPTFYSREEKIISWIEDLGFYAEKTNIFCRNIAKGYIKIYFEKNALKGIVYEEISNPFMAIVPSVEEKKEVSINVNKILSREILYSEVVKPLLEGMNQY